MDATIYAERVDANLDPRGPKFWQTYLHASKMAANDNVAHASGTKHSPAECLEMAQRARDLADDMYQQALAWVAVHDFVTEHDAYQNEARK